MRKISLMPVIVAKKPERFWLGLIILAAILLRVAAAFYLGDRVVELPGTQDQISYNLLAQRVLAGHGFSFAQDWWPVTGAGEPTAHWSYLYTLYLVAIYGLVGYHPLVARLIQAVLVGLLMPWLTYRLGRRHFNGPVGLVAAGISAFYIYFIYYGATLMTECFYIVGILWSLDLAGQVAETNDRPKSGFTLRLFLLLGLALAVTVLFRQVFLLFIPLLYGWLAWYALKSQVKENNAGNEGGTRRSLLRRLGVGLRTRQMARLIAGLGLATIILVGAITPWTVRNYRVFDSFVLLNTNAGFAFFWGNHPIHGYNFISILPDDGPAYQDLIPAELKEELNEGELDRALLKEGLAYIQADPLRYVILSVSRIKDYFKFWPSPESGLISNLSRVFSFGLLWPFMLYGLFTNVRRSLFSTTAILYLFVIFYTTIHLLSWALIRYRLPVDAILIVFAGAACVDIYIKLMQRSESLKGLSLNAKQRYFRPQR